MAFIYSSVTLDPSYYVPRSTSTSSIDSVKMAPTLLDLPLEVLHAILVQADPQDIARFRCCRTLNDYIKGNHLLFREMYLKYFVSSKCLKARISWIELHVQDDPTNNFKNDYAWESELFKRVTLQNLLRSNDIAKKVGWTPLRCILIDPYLQISSMDFILSSTSHLLETSATDKPNEARNVLFLTQLFETSPNTTGLMCSSLLFDLAKAEMINKHQHRARASSDSSLDRGVYQRGSIENSDDALSSRPGFECSNETHHTRQLSAKLHVLYGVPIQYARHPSGDGPRYELRSDLRARSIHPYARSL